jgi:hypothetical protein
MVQSLAVAAAAGPQRGPSNHKIIQVIDVVKKLVRGRPEVSFGGEAWARVFDGGSRSEFCDASLFAHDLLSDAMTSELPPMEAIERACEHQFERAAPCYPSPVVVFVEGKVAVYGQVRRATGSVYCLAHALAIKKVSRG